LLADSSAPNMLFVPRPLSIFDPYCKHSANWHLPSGAFISFRVLLRTFSPIPPLASGVGGSLRPLCCPPCSDSRFLRLATLPTILFGFFSRPSFFWQPSFCPDLAGGFFFSLSLFPPLRFQVHASLCVFSFLTKFYPVVAKLFCFTCLRSSRNPER